LRQFFVRTSFIVVLLEFLRVNMDTVKLKYLLSFVTLITGEIDFITSQNYVGFVARIFVA